MKRDTIKLFPLILVSAVGLVLIVSYASTLFSLRWDEKKGYVSCIDLSPWRSIGGCGAGGSGGGTGDGIKWIGKGVSGGLVDLELLPRYNFGQNYANLTIAPRISYKLSWNNTIALSVPVVSKHGDVQIQTNMRPVHHSTGGLGDLTLDYTRTFGPAGRFDFTLGITLPTGQYDIKRGRDSEKYFLPGYLQKGKGIYILSGTLSHARDVENGIWLFDLNYNFPFNMRPVSRENSFLDEYFSNYKDLKDDERFYYRFKPYGENDLGDVTPMSFGVSTAYGYRGIEGQVHSFGVTFSAPIGDAYINQVDIVNNGGEFSESIYNKAIVDPDFRTWSSAFVYGLEISKRRLPLFLAVSLPLHAETNADDPGKLAGPDWSDFGQEWTFALGFKASLFQ